MKQKKNFFFGKKNQNGWLKKSAIFNSPNFQYFFMKISLIGPWVELNDVKGIYVAQPRKPFKEKWFQPNEN